MANDEPDENLGGKLQEEEHDTAPAGYLADPQNLVDSRIPMDVREKYEFFSYKNAAVILAETRVAEWHELLEALRAFTISTDVIQKAGGNESDIPKRINDLLRPKNWHETVIRGDLLVRLLWKEQVGVTKGGKAKFEKREAAEPARGFLTDTKSITSRTR
ncbi:BglII/BstYI family type II restriction endonuclease [Pseudaminobacter sp. NGMCC 1.201702]|uniref:BglII/BstYI family type II restriction endonuclease n=1 Tax=Pseudaminobacter sp. NGMCC 1.201702 TaxID=3391825 RepID=UPI0039EE069E